MKDTHYYSEADEWGALRRQRHWEEYLKLWDYFVSMGGSLDPAPDSQSPFDFVELQRAVPADGRAGVHVIQRV